MAEGPTGRKLTVVPEPRDGGLRIHPAPAGRDRLRWLGPGIVWMVAAMGSGELLFTPRVGAQYGYTLLWALLGAAALKWFINREVGRFAVCTGATVLDGFKTVPGPRNWAVWVIVVPQLIVAAAAIAGFASSAATGLTLVLPGPLWLWTLLPLAASTALVFFGRYSHVESATKVFAVVLGFAALTAAVSVFDSGEAFLAGLKPGLDPEVRYGEVLPWLGYAISGAAGFIWYSYWITSKGYGAARSGSLDPAKLSDEEQQALRGWVRLMSWDATLAVTGAVIIILAFLVLGAELLQPLGMIPEEREVARTLGRLLEPVWGRFGFWVMVAGVVVGFWGTLLSNQDGFGRMFANGAQILAERRGLRGRAGDELFLRRVFVVVSTAVVPAGLFLLVGNPVSLLKLSGSIEACHLPVVSALVLYLNLRRLPPSLRPSRFAVGGMIAAVLFFVAFAAFYLVQQLGGRGGAG